MTKIVGVTEAGHPVFLNDTNQLEFLYQDKTFQTELLYMDSIIAKGALIEVPNDKFPLFSRIPKLGDINLFTQIGMIYSDIVDNKLHFYMLEDLQPTLVSSEVPLC